MAKLQKGWIWAILLLVLGVAAYAWWQHQVGMKEHAGTTHKEHGGKEHGGT